MSLDLVDEINKILDEYALEVNEDVNKAAKATAKLGAKELKSTSPKSKSKVRGGRYARGWAVKETKGTFGYTQLTIHNKKDYQLTHLLENGHLIRNKTGTYGRTKARPHIKPVELIVQDKFLEEVKKRLN